MPEGGYVSNAPIVFPPPSATTPFEANNDEHFKQRAQIAIAYEANRAFPGDWWGGEINGDAQVNNAIARLALGLQCLKMPSSHSQTLVRLRPCLPSSTMLRWGAVPTR
jgi:hypothetical protein